MGRAAQDRAPDPAQQGWPARCSSWPPSCAVPAPNPSSVRPTSVLAVGPVPPWGAATAWCAATLGCSRRGEGDGSRRGRALARRVRASGERGRVQGPDSGPRTVTETQLAAAPPFPYVHMTLSPDDQLGQRRRFWSCHPCGTGLARPGVAVVQSRRETPGAVATPRATPRSRGGPEEWRRRHRPLDRITREFA
jgi:hypothetical protein